MNHLGVVVEGRADVALSDFVRRYLAEAGHTGIGVASAIRANDRGQLLRKEGQLEKLVYLAATKEDAIGVLVFFDADKDPACELGPETLARVESRHPKIRIRICAAVRNIENWIMASAETTVEQNPLDDPEGPGAIQALKEAYKPRSYNKPAHQPSLLAKIDFDLARQRCPSLDRVLRILDEIAEASG